MRHDTPHEDELRIRRWDGEYRWFQVRVDPVRDAGGAVVRWVGACTDVDDLRRAWAEAREARRLVRAFVDRGPEGHALVGSDWVVRYTSPWVAAFLGRPSGACAGTDARDGVHRDDRPRLVAAVDDLLGRPGERMDVEARLRHSDGSYPRVRLKATNLLPDPDVRAVAVVIEPAGDG